MEYDPKCYYPGGWKEIDGERKKQIYSWESLEPGEIEGQALVALKVEDNGWFAVDLAAPSRQSCGHPSCHTAPARAEFGLPAPTPTNHGS